ncbi:hypothetical protein GYMLUDRAFT_38329 [Collybiopsis luxurians FD-317 M1]|nr:hypothetical protein GYMLUDRAFT_38329 [Collybiopsis luxurians FD-317 M1]
MKPQSDFPTVQATITEPPLVYHTPAHHLNSNFNLHFHPSVHPSVHPCLRKLRAYHPFHTTPHAIPPHYTTPHHTTPSPSFRATSPRIDISSRSDQILTLLLSEHPRAGPGDHQKKIPTKYKQCLPASMSKAAKRSTSRVSDLVRPPSASNIPLLLAPPFSSRPLRPDRICTPQSRTKPPLKGSFQHTRCFPVSISKSAKGLASIVSVIHRLSQSLPPFSPRSRSCSPRYPAPLEYPPSLIQPRQDTHKPQNRSSLTQPAPQPA